MENKSNHTRIYYQATLFYLLISHSTCLLVVHPIDHYELVCKALRYKSLTFINLP